MIPVHNTTSSYPYSSSKKNRNKIRSMSLPSPPPLPPLPPPLLPSNLPPDPKKWTSSHVASYLTYCLRLHPPTIISDLVRYVEEDATLTGRKFLRLKEEQLRQMNFNERWIKLIMIGIKELRREHLKGKILLSGCDIINEDPDEIEMKGFVEENEERFSLGRSSSYSSYSSSTSTTATVVSNSSFSNNDFKDFLVPTSFSNLTSDDKEFIRREFNKLKEFLKSDVKNENDRNDINFNELNQIIEKAISNTGTSQEDRTKKPSMTRRSLFSLSSLFSWLNDEWAKKTYFESSFVQGVMIGGAAVWAYMKYSK